MSIQCLGSGSSSSSSSGYHNLHVPPALQEDNVDI
jgi:hypothetical protein